MLAQRRIPVALFASLALLACSPTEKRSPSYAEVVRADRPASYWRFGEASGSLAAHDELGVADGKVQGGVTRAPGTISGDPDGAFAFDGMRSSVVLPDLYTFEGKHPFAIEVWIAPIAAGTPIQRICNHRIGPAHTGWRLLRDQPQRITFERWSGDVVLGTVSAEVPLDKYSHIVARYDGATVEIYVDGLLRQAAPDAHDIALYKQALVWAAGNVGDEDFFVGRLDEAAIYDFALAPDRIAAHHAAALR